MTWVRRHGGVSRYWVEPVPPPVELRQVAAMAQRNEVGFAVCKTVDGRLVRGPKTEGTPTSVQVDLVCPPGSKLAALYHSHPGGVAKPSALDVQSALRAGVTTLLINADGDMRAYRLAPKR